MRRYKAVIVGLGRIGQGFDLDAERRPRAREARSYAGAFGLHPRIDLAAACDPDAGKRRLFERGHPKARVYAAFDDLLRAERPDIVAVACSTGAHARTVREALDSGKRSYLILEKPFCSTYREAKALARALRRARARAVVNFSRRWLPALRRARRLAAAGSLGRPRRGLAYFTKGLVHNGCHMVDLLSSFLGPLQEPRVTATRPGGEIDVRARAGPAEVHLLAGRAAEYSLNEADMLFSGGRVRLAENGRRIEVWRARPNSWASGRRLELDEGMSGPTALGSALSLMIDEVVRELDGGAPAGGCTVGEALRTLRFCERSERLAQRR